MEELQFNNLSLNGEEEEEQISYLFNITENGVFANRDIQRGEKICYYPIDALEFYDDDWTYNDNTNKFKINSKHNISIEIHLKNNVRNEYDNHDENLIMNIFDEFELAEPHQSGSYCNNSCMTLSLLGTSNSSINNKHGIGHLINDCSSTNTNPLENHSLFLEESRKKQNVSWDENLKKYGNNYGLNIYAIKNISRGEELFMFYNNYYVKINNSSKLGVFASKASKEYANINNMDMDVIESGGSGKNGKFTKKDLQFILSGYNALK